MHHLAQSVAFEISGANPHFRKALPSIRQPENSIRPALPNKIIEISGKPVNRFHPTGTIWFRWRLGIHVDGNPMCFGPAQATLMATPYTTGIFGFDLPGTNKLVYRFSLPTDTSKNFFNDLAIADNGDLFKNSDGSSIWCNGRFKTPRPEKQNCPRLPKPNGIVWDKDRQSPFLAKPKGLVALSTATKTLHALCPMVKHPPDLMGWYLRTICRATVFAVKPSICGASHHQL